MPLAIYNGKKEPNVTTEQTAIVPSFLDDDYIIPDNLPGVQIEPGRLQWQHGATAGSLKAPGVFFAKETAFTEAPAVPWTLDERFLESDGPGYSAARLDLAFIGERWQWFIPGETRNDPATWLPNGTRAPEGVKIKKLIEYLVLINGLADPMVLSVSGYYKSRPIEDMLRWYERGTLAQLIRRHKRQLPRWACWLTIGGKVDDKGKPLIEKANDAAGTEYGSEVTPPTLIGQPTLVTRAVFEQAIEVWNLYNNIGWFKFQRLPANTVDAAYTVHTMPALPAGRNVPQPIDDVPDL